MRNKLLRSVALVPLAAGALLASGAPAEAQYSRCPDNGIVVVDVNCSWENDSGNLETCFLYVHHDRFIVSESVCLPAPL